MHAFLDFETGDNFACKAIETMEKTGQPTESGFDYVCGTHGAKLFKKRER